MKQEREELESKLDLLRREKQQQGNLYLVPILLSSSTDSISDVLLLFVGTTDYSIAPFPFQSIDNNNNNRIVNIGSKDVIFPRS